MKIWHISDTHGYHDQLVVEDADIVVHSGDCCNDRDLTVNKSEWEDFAEWYPSLPHKYKILVLGNHDSFAYNNYKKVKSWAADCGIHLLHDSHIVIENIKFFGSPFTPTYGTVCAFMVKREGLHKHWAKIDDDTNIVVTHGPPKGILDLSEDRDHTLKQGGCSALMKRINKLKNVKAHLFGHFHDEPNICNQGLLIRDRVVYSNASCLKIGKRGEINSHGNILYV